MATPCETPTGVGQPPAYIVLPCLVLAACGQSDESQSTDARSRLAPKLSPAAERSPTLPGPRPSRSTRPAPLHLRQAKSATLRAGEARNGDERRRLRSRKEAGRNKQLPRRAVHFPASLPWMELTRESTLRYLAPLANQTETRNLKFPTLLYTVLCTKHLLSSGSDSSGRRHRTVQISAWDAAPQSQLSAMVTVAHTGRPSTANDWPLSQLARRLRARIHHVHVPQRLPHT